MRKVYRKKYGGDVWHWCENCSGWPKEDYTVRHYIPHNDKGCEECQKLDDEGKCEKKW